VAPAPDASNRFSLALASLALLLVTDARAGPPFVTDDPEPVGKGHWEINSAVTGTRSDAGTMAFAPQIDINYGAAAGVQLHVMPQLAYSSSSAEPAGRRAYGVGDTEYGIKLRLIDEDSATGEWMAAIYPFYEAPTGSARRGLGAGAQSEYLPLWLQWRAGGWTTYGGGGYWFNAGAGRRNAWSGGWVVLYQFTPALQFGAEAFARTADSDGARGAAGADIGGTYDLRDDVALLFSAGRGIVNAASTDQASWYLGIRITR